ncbi:MAG: hypothetical protein IJP44_14415 [Bacteroidales bacterium]|nr:hypothetical protein [Bacteroidales bacterium]
MRRILLSVALSLGFVAQLAAQTPRDIMKEAIPVAMFQVTYAFHLPALDQKETYGISNTIGGSFVYKTESNWLFTANGNYIFGRKVKGDRIDIFGEGITTEHGEIIGGGGSVALFSVNQRGFHFQAEVGKLFPFWPNPNSGFFVQAGAGYLRNRTRIDFQQEMYNTPYPVYGDYEYGYDRMRGGLAAHLEAGYLYIGDNRITNLSVSLEVTYARTRDLRDYDFRVFDGVPVGHTDPNKRYNDLYYGIRVSWNIPTYQRQPEAYYYN